MAVKSALGFRGSKKYLLNLIYIPYRIFCMEYAAEAHNRHFEPNRSTTILPINSAGSAVRDQHGEIRSEQ